MAFIDGSITILLPEQARNSRVVVDVPRVLQDHLSEGVELNCQNLQPLFPGSFKPESMRQDQSIIITAGTGLAFTSESM